MRNELLSKNVDEIKTTVRTVITKLLPLIRSHKEAVPSVDSNLVASCLKLISIYLNKEHMIKFNDKEKYADPRRIQMTYIAFSLIWSLGANLHDKSRHKFNEQFRTEMKKHFPEFPDEDIYELGLDAEKHDFK